MNYEKQTTPDRNVRLSRRGRAALVATGAVLVAGIGMGVEAAGDNGSETIPTHSYVVVPGDTLWNIAKDDVDGGASHTGEIVQKIEDDPANKQALENGQIDPGEVLQVPDSAK